MLPCKLVRCRGLQYGCTADRSSDGTGVSALPSFRFAALMLDGALRFSVAKRMKLGSAAALRLMPINADDQLQSVQLPIFVKRQIYGSFCSLERPDTPDRLRLRQVPAEENTDQEDDLCSSLNVHFVMAADLSAEANELHRDGILLPHLLLCPGLRFESVLRRQR